MNGASPPADRKTAHLLLDQFLHDATQFTDLADEDSRAQAARLLLLNLVSTAGQIAGQDLLRAAYGGADMEPLSGLARRLVFQEWLFASVEDPSGEYATSKVIEEIEAIAGGDAPRLFAKRASQKGVPTNRHRIAHRRLQMLFWDKYLEAIGQPAAARQAEISLAFGMTWEALRKDRPNILKALGPELVEAHLRRAHIAGQREKDPHRSTYAEMLRADARAYVREMKKGAV